MQGTKPCSSLFKFVHGLHSAPYMENHKKHLAHCFELIAQKLSRGPIHVWDTRDFQLLSESIHKETGTLLSVSTLKRLSGKVNYTSRPNSSTLNVLATYLDHKDWRTFLSHESNGHIQKRNKVTPPLVIQYSKPLIAIGLILVTIFLLIYSKPVVSYNANDFDFEVRSVSTGLPNSVVFKYNAKAADTDASVAIQQDWDKRKRVVVHRRDSISTSIYHWPGYFKAKLVVDDSIVKEKALLIPTEDWLGTIETDSMPIYLDKEEYLSEDGVGIAPDILQTHGVNPHARRTVVGFYQVRDFGSIYTDDFDISVRLKNSLISGASPCQAAQVVIMHEDGPISIVLSDKGCISDISLFAFDSIIDGKKTDLSGFGVDMSQDIQLDCSSKDQHMDIRINNESVFTLNVPQRPRKIVGISILFEGAGIINDVVLSNGSGPVYSLGRQGQ